MIIDLIEWIYDHRMELTFNTLLLFILRKFILKELTKLFRFNRNVASLNNQRVIMRVLGVEKEWDAGRLNLNRITVTKSLNGLRTITSHVHITELFTRRMAIKKLYWRKLKMNTQNINYATLIPTILGAAKLILQTFGIEIPDTVVNEIVNGAAAVGTVIGIFMAHRKQVLVPTVSADPNKFIQG